MKVILQFTPSYLQAQLRKLFKSAVGRKLLYGTFWNLSGTMVSRILGLIVSIILARYIGKESFGKFAIIQSTILMFGVLAGIGLGVTTTKHVAEFKKVDSGKAGRIITLCMVLAFCFGTIATIIMYEVSGWLAINMLAAPQLGHLLKISSPILLFSVLDGVQMAALAGFEAFKKSAILNLLKGIVTFPFMICGVIFAGIEGAIWGLLASSVTGYFINNVGLAKVASKHNVPLKIMGCVSEYKIIIQFGFPAALASIMVMPANWMCTAILANQPNGYGELGIYNAATQWFTVLLFIPTALSQVLLPFISERVGLNTGDKVRLDNVLVNSMKLNAIIVIPIIIIGSLVSPFIMSLYGASFREGWSTLIVTLITAGILSVQAPISNMIIATNRMWYGFSVNVFWAIIFVISTFALVQWGAFGLATSKGVSYLFQTALILVFVYYVLFDRKKIISTNKINRQCCKVSEMEPL